MRIPRRKVYRAFSEFDGMSDADCRRYLRSLGRHGKLHRWVPWVLFPIMFVAMVAIDVIVLRVLGPSVARYFLFVSMDQTEFKIPGMALWVSLTDVFLSFLLGLSLGGVPALVAWLCRDFLIRRVLSKQIRLATCPGCLHSLIGLPIDADEAGGGPRTRCPECGELWLLRDLGLTPADLRPDAVPGGA